MSKKIKYIDDSIFEKAVEKDMDKVFSGLDTQKMVDEMVENAIKSGHNTSSSERVLPKKKRSPIKSFVAVAACAVICALGITGGVMNNMDNTKSITPTNTVNNGVDESDKPTNKAVETKTTRETVVTVENKTPKQDPGKVKTGTITLKGGDCHCNHLNPTKIQLTKASIKNGSCSWIITSYKTNKVIKKGNGTTISSELTTLLEDKKDGDYLATFTYKDKQNNSIKVHEVFTINSGEILPGQYN